MVVKKTKKRLVKGKRTKKVCQKGGGGPKGKGTKRKSQKKTTGPNLTVTPNTPHTSIMSRLLSKTNRFNSKVNLTKRVEAENFVPLLSEDKSNLTKKLNKTGYPQYSQKLNLKTQTGIQGEKTKQDQMVKMRKKFGGTANIIRIGFNDVLITPKNPLYKPYTVKIGKEFNKTSYVLKSVFHISNPQFVKTSILNTVPMINLSSSRGRELAENVSKKLRETQNETNNIKNKTSLEITELLRKTPTRPAPPRPPPPTYQHTNKPPQYSPKPPPPSTKPPLVLSPLTYSGSTAA